MSLIFLFLICVSYVRGYVLGPYAMSFIEAEVYCKSLNSHLATIRDTTDRDEARALCQTADGSFGGCWIGLYDSATRWRWKDWSSTWGTYGFDTTGNPTTGIDPWWPGEPSRSNGNEYCVHLYAGHQFNWNDCNCAALNYPICNDPPPCSELLSDLTPTETFGSFYSVNTNHRHPSAPLDGIPVTFYSNYLVSTAKLTSTNNESTSYGEYQLKGKYSRLTGKIGRMYVLHGQNLFQCDGLSQGKFTTRIIVDGIIYYESELFDSVTRIDDIDIDIAGANIVRIEITQTISDACDVMLFVDPCLMPRPGEEVCEIDLCDLYDAQQQSSQSNNGSFEVNNNDYLLTAVLITNIVIIGLITYFIQIYITNQSRNYTYSKVKPYQSDTEN